MSQDAAPSDADAAADGAGPLIESDGAVVDSMTDPIDADTTAIDCRSLHDVTRMPDGPCVGPIRWQRTLVRDSNYDRSFVAFDAAGNVYWMLSVERASELGGNDGFDDLPSRFAMLGSYSPDGTERWTFEVEGAHADGLTVTDSQACVALSSTSRATVFSDKLDAELSGNDTIACLSLDGELRWARDIRGTSTSLENMTSDAQGNLYVAGSFRVTLAVSPSLSAESRDIEGDDRYEGDGFIASYAADGATRWLTTAGGPGTDELKDAAALSDGRVAILGEHAGDIEIGAGPTPDLGPSDRLGGAGFVALLDQNGALIWAARAPDLEGFPEETLATHDILIDARDRIIATYDYSGFYINVYGDDGSLTSEHTANDIGATDCDSLAAHRDGFACFGDWEDPYRFDGALIMTGFDFDPRSLRVLLGPMTNGGGIGRTAAAVGPDGTVAVTARLSDMEVQRLIVLDP